MAATAAIAWPSYSAFSRAMMLRVTCQKFTRDALGPDVVELLVRQVIRL